MQPPVAICYKCYIEKYGLIRRGLSTEQYMYAHQVSYDDALKRNKKFISASKDSFTRRYGEEEGAKKWDEYRDFQAKKNTFEYKQEKYGITREEFNKFNKLRATTLENFINRYGEDIGCKKWDEYCKVQAYAGSTLTYFEKKFGHEEGVKKWNEINYLKSHSKDVFIIKYGEEDGIKRWNNYIQRKSVPYSKISQKLFWYIYDILPDALKQKCYFAELNNEFGINYNNNYFKYDFVISSIKLCIEFNGDFWHANPKIYKENEIIKFNSTTQFVVKDIWEKDIVKNNLIINHGYNILIIWESDYINFKDNIIKLILDKIGELYEDRIC